MQILTQSGREYRSCHLAMSISDTEMPESDYQAGHIKTMLLYRFLTAKYGLESVKNRELKFTRLMDLNDPFEFIGVKDPNPLLQKALCRNKEYMSERTGVLCFSATRESPLLWSHYAEKHTGICLGLEMPEECCAPINYADSRLDVPAGFMSSLANGSKYREKLAFMKELIYTKFSHWKYEEEYRVWVTPEGTEDGDFIGFHSAQLTLREVIIGMKSTVTYTDVLDCLDDPTSEVKVFKAKPSWTSFKMEMDEMRPMGVK